MWRGLICGILWQPWMANLCIQMIFVKYCLNIKMATEASTPWWGRSVVWHTWPELSEPPLDGMRCINKMQCSRQLQCKVPCSVGGVINSSLFIESSLSSTNHTVHGGGLPPVAGSRVPRGGWGRGHFSPAAIYCTTTWCFAPKGLRTIKDSRLGKTVSSEIPNWSFVISLQVLSWPQTDVWLLFGHLESLAQLACAV